MLIFSTTRRRPWAWITVAAVLWVAVACQSKVATLPKTPDPDMPSVERVAVMPFQDMRSLYGEGVAFRCPLCLKSFIIGDVKTGADVFLTNLLSDMLVQRKDIGVIAPDQAQGVWSTIAFNSPEDWSDLDRIVETGRVLEADAVLVGRVYRFEERGGTRYASRTPATVSMDMVLVGTQDGRLLWEAEFTETQKALFDDLFQIGTFFQRGARWLSAEELATYGMKQVLETFPAP
jgi:hypothetical protein